MEIAGLGVEVGVDEGSTAQEGRSPRSPSLSFMVLGLTKGQKGRDEGGSWEGWYPKRKGQKGWGRGQLLTRSKGRRGGREISCGGKVGKCLEREAVGV